MTFLGGLYFILEYVVPPTMPFATHVGICVSKEVPKIHVVTVEGYPFDQEVADGVAIFVRRRDALGEFQDKEVKSRLVGVGDSVKIRTRSVTLGKFAPGEAPIDDGNKPIVFRPGERPYPTEGTETDLLQRTFQRLVGRTDADGAANLWAMQPGEKVNVEVQYAKVTAIDRGAVDILVKQQRTHIPLTGNSLLMRVKRRSDPEEVEVFQANVGDTLRLGPNTFFRDQRDTAAQFNSVIGTLALGMGLLSLGMVNIKKIKRREKEWYTAILFFLAIGLGVLAGVGKYEPVGMQLRTVSDNTIILIFGSLGSAIFSLTAFYLASAAYRAFRVRTVEAAIMMVTAVLVMLGQTPFGAYLTGWIPERFQFLWLSNIAGWILRIPSSAFMRALTFGLMLGAIATALRYWLSLERVASGDD